MPRVAFGLGGNVGDVHQTIRRATALLCALPYANASTVICSAYFHSEALLDEDAPEEWNIAFVNQVITLECNIHDMEALLHDVKRIEQQLGRQYRGHWSPREIDIDIIAVEGVRYASDTLTIPHKEAQKREFVMRPLREIWADCNF